MNNNIKNNSKDIPLDVDLTVHRLKEFELPENGAYTFLSARRTGKSFFIRNLVYLLLQKKMIDVIYCFSYTADMDDAYNWLAKEYIFSPDIIGKTIKLLFKVQKATPKNKRMRVLIICDDFDITSPNKDIDTLYTRGRHYNITTILSAQIATKGVSTAIRGNTELLFVRELNIEALEDHVFPMLTKSPFRKTSVFADFVEDHTNDHQFILYIKDATLEKKEKIKIVKAQECNFQFTYSKTKSKNKNDK